MKNYAIIAQARFKKPSGSGVSGKTTVTAIFSSTKWIFQAHACHPSLFLSIFCRKYLQLSCAIFYRHVHIDKLQPVALAPSTRQYGHT